MPLGATQSIVAWRARGWDRGGRPAPADSPADAVDRPAPLLYVTDMAIKLVTTVRLDSEDARALARARKAGLRTSDLIRQGLRLVAGRFYTRGKRPPHTRLFVPSEPEKLGDEAALFRHLEEK